MVHKATFFEKAMRNFLVFTFICALASLHISPVFADTYQNIGLNPVFWNWNSPLSKDTFTATDGQNLKVHTPDVGQPWSVQNNSNEWTIQNNQLTRTAGVIQSASVDVGQSNMMACADFKKFANEASLYSIMVRWQDPAHYWEIFYDSQNNGWQMSLVNGGADQFQGPVLSGGSTGTVCISAIGNTITAQSPNGETYSVVNSSLNANTKAALIVNGNSFVNDPTPPPVIEASAVDNWIVVGPSSSNIMAQSSYITAPLGSITNSMLAGSISSNKLIGTDIDTVGTITNGIWNATPIGVNKGGTGLSSFGSANQLIGMNANADGAEYKSIGAGTSGSDFNIGNTPGLITFNIPDASLTSRGVVTSGAQTFGGDKKFTGKVGIGDTTPLSLLTVGNGDLFQIDGTGAIIAATGIQSSGAIKFTGLTTGAWDTTAVFLNGSNQLVTRTLGSNAFTNTSYLTSEGDTLQTVTTRNPITSNNVRLNGGAITKGLAVESSDSNSDRITTEITTGGSYKFDGKITNTDLTANRTYVLPDTSGTFLMADSSAAALTNFPVLNQNTTGKSGQTDGLNSATSTVNVSAAAAPTAGQVLTATDPTHAKWQSFPTIINGQTISANSNFHGTMSVGDGTGSDNAVFNTGTGIFAIKPALSSGSAVLLQSNALTQTGIYNALNISLGNVTPDGSNPIRGAIISAPKVDNASNAVALAITGANWDSDITLQNGASIDNNTPGVIDIGATLRFNIITTGDTNIGLCKDKADGNALDISLRECKSAAGDIAEEYAAEGNLRPGDVVAIQTKGGTPTLYKTTQAYENNAFSVVSTYPVGQFGKPLSADTIDKENNPTAIGIAGKVPVRVTTQGGAIKVGDPLVASSIPGVAMKATKAGKIMGYALESFDGSVTVSQEVRKQEKLRNESSVKYNLEPKDPTAKSEGKIIMYLSNGYYYPEFANTVAQVAKLTAQVSVLDTKANIASETTAHAGQVKISKGSTKVSIRFNSSYANTPIVTALLVGANEVNRIYADNITKDGFDLVIFPVQKKDVRINWQATEER